MASPTTSPMKAARTRLGWTQVQLAEALDLDVATVSRLERGELPLRRLHLLALERLVAQRKPKLVRTMK